MAEQTLILGTLFTGKLDPSFKKYLVSMKRLVRGVGDEFTRTGTKATRATAKVKQFTSAVNASNKKSKMASSGVGAGFASAGNKAGVATSQIMKYNGVVRDSVIQLVRSGGVGLANRYEHIGRRAFQATSPVLRFTQALKRIFTTMGGGGGAIGGGGGPFRLIGDSAKGASSKVGSFTEKVVDGKEPVKKYGGFLTRIGKAFKTLLAYGAAGAVIMGITQALRAGLSEIVAYDQALKNLEAISGATTLELIIMGDKIKDVARTTRFSTREIGQGMVTITQAGFTAVEAIQTMQAVADLSTGTLTSMTTVSDLLTTALRAFNLEALQSGRVADVMANAVNKSKLTVDKLRIAFNFAGAASAQAGLSIEQTAASMMVLANNGLRASTIGTGFRQVLKRLIAPNERLRDAYLQAGVALDGLTIDQTQSYEKVLMNITRVLFDAETRTVDMAKAFKLFGLRGSQAAAILVKEYASGRFKQAIDRTFDIGTAAKMAGIQFQGLKVSIKNLKDNWGLLFVALGEGGIKTALSVVLQLAKKLIVVFTDLASRGFSSAIMQVTLLTGAIWGSVKAVNALVKAWQMLAKSRFMISLMSTGGIAALGSSWIGLIALFVASATIAIYKFITASDRLGDSFLKLAADHHGVAISLESYAGALEEISKRLNGPDAKTARQEYEATLERFVKDHPIVAKSLDVYTTSIKNNIEAMKNASTDEYSKELKERLSATRELTSAETARNISSGLWEFAKGDFNGFLNQFSITYKFLEKMNGIAVGSIEELRNETFKMIDSVSLNDFPPQIRGIIFMLKKLSGAAGVVGRDLEIIGEDIANTGKNTKAGQDAIKKTADAFYGIAEIIRNMQLKKKDFSIDDYLDINKMKLSKEEYAALEAQMKKVIAKEKELAKERARIDAENARYARAEEPDFFKNALGQTDDQGIINKLRASFDTYESVLATELERIDAQEGRFYGNSVKRAEEKEKAKVDALQDATLEMMKILKASDISLLTEQARTLRVELDKINSQKKNNRDQNEVNSLQDKLALANKELAILLAGFNKLMEDNPTLKTDDLTFLNPLIMAFDKLDIKVNKADQAVNDTFKNWEKIGVDVGNSLVDNIANGFGEIASGADSMAERFQSMAQRMIQDMIALISKVLMLKALLGATGGWTGGGLVNKFAQAGLGKLGFDNPVSSVAGSAIGGMARSSTPIANNIINPIGNMVTPKVARSVSGGGGTTTTTNHFKINAVDAGSFNKLLSNRGARAIMVNTITSNKQHNGVIRSGN